MNNGEYPQTATTDKVSVSIAPRNFDSNFILLTDSYKVTHWKQYPPKTTNIYSYWESRGGDHPEVIAFGMKYYLQKYFSKPITVEDVNEAEEVFALHFNDKTLFNKAAWLRLIEKHGGYLPLRIKFAPEGTPIPTRNVIMTMENTDDEFPWLTNYAETLVSMLWYPSTVATISRAIKARIKQYLEETGDVAGLPFKLHDFGFRGTSSVESAAIGGTAHLLNFKGTDTLAAIMFARQFYDEKMAGFSIPAAEHSTITSWLRENESEAYRNMVKQFADGGSGLYAVVSDSFNIYDACKNIWGEELKNLVLAHPNVLVIRPDSGVPHEVVRQITEILGDKFGYTVNEKGYKVLNKVRVIQGDGINYEEIGRILEALKIRGWSADNVAFGMGGALLQKMDRDTQKFAIKASSAIVNGQIRDFNKTPTTDSSKWSKSGRLKLVRNAEGVLETRGRTEEGKDILETVFENGKVLTNVTLAEARTNAELQEKVPVWM